MAGKRNFVCISIAALVLLIPCLLTPGAFARRAVVPQPKKNMAPMQIPPALTTIDKDFCVRCHASQGGVLARSVTDWKKSVHAATGSNCNLCHGGNPGINNKALAKSAKYYFIGRPANTNITPFCGRGGCHETALDQFKRGPHYDSVLKVNHPNCTDCHGVHNIQRPTYRIIQANLCTGCHPAGYAKSIIVSLTEIDRGFTTVRDNLAYLDEKQVEHLRLTERLENAEHLFRQLVHVFSSNEIKSTKDIIELEINNLITESNSRVTITKRLDFLYLTMTVIGLIIIMAILGYTIFMYSRRRP